MAYFPRWLIFIGKASGPVFAEQDLPEIERRVSVTVLMAA